jgi:hypothetical protein
MFTTTFRIALLLAFFCPLTLPAKDWDFRNWGWDLRLDTNDLRPAAVSLKKQRISFLGSEWGMDSVRFELRKNEGLIVHVKLGSWNEGDFASMGSASLSLQPTWNVSSETIHGENLRILNLETPFPAGLVALARPVIENAIASELKKRPLIDLSDRFSSNFLRRVRVDDGVLIARYTIW